LSCSLSTVDIDPELTKDGLGFRDIALDAAPTVPWEA
jgi:hypothetical protein